MPELIILRHAHAIRYHYDDDFNRRLRQKGKRNAQRVGVWLATNQMLPDKVYSSPATRALTTAEKACKSSGLDTSVITIKTRLYTAGWQDFKELLKKVPDDKARVMLVGHNPGLEELVSALATETPATNSKGNILSPASFAILRFDGLWRDLKKHSARIESIVHADSLPEFFPYPLHNPVEWRERPAYYYTQSAVIPFKYAKHTLQIMLITSSSKKHWVVPKGIHEPGLTSRQSAAREAMEEAAIKGRIIDSRIGVYRYIKWGAECEVSVFAMRVKKQLDNNDWKENHRDRIWVSYEKAQKMLDNRDLSKMVKKLPEWLKKNYL